LRPRVRRAPTEAARRGALILTLLVVAGCGKKGPPLPPEPRGPLPPRGVAARQVGETVEFLFEVPGPRGPKPAQQPVRAELVRLTYQAGAQPPPDPDAFRRRGEVVQSLEGDPFVPGSRIRLRDLRLSELTDQGAGLTLRYAVRVLDRRGRSSPLVVAEDLVPEAPKPAPRELTAVPTADGVRLIWQPPTDGDTELKYNLYRSAPDGPEPRQPLNAEPLTVTEFLDTKAITGSRYRYFVRVVLAEGKPLREGESSVAVELVADDRFAPARPEGLVAVQEGLAVRLFWNPNGERDLAGYRMFRKVGDRDWQRIGPDPVEQSTLLDSDVAAGQRLAYRVVAIDRVDPPNVSEPSSVVELELAAEPAAPGGAP